MNDGFFLFFLFCFRKKVMIKDFFVDLIFKNLEKKIDFCLINI